MQLFQRSVMLLKVVRAWSIISLNVNAPKGAPAQQARGSQYEQRGISLCHHTFVGFDSWG